MKLSEAIVLGSTVLAPQPGIQFVQEKQSGCAFGMASVARGATYGVATHPFPEKDTRTLGVDGVWGKWVNVEVRRPCNCWLTRPRKMRIRDIITHIFDDHYMGKRRHWSLDQLVAWVRTVEPINPERSQEVQLLQEEPTC